MGVEVVGFETVEAPVEIVASSVRDNVTEEKENGKVDEASPPKKSHEPIKFGSHVDEPVKKEANGVASSDAANFPKDAADEWPAQKQVHSFFLVRFRQYDDPKIMSKLDQAALETEKRNQARFKITEQLKAKRVSFVNSFKWRYSVDFFSSSYFNMFYKIERLEGLVFLHCGFSFRLVGMS